LRGKSWWLEEGQEMVSCQGRLPRNEEECRQHQGRNREVRLMMAFLCSPHREFDRRREVMPSFGERGISTYAALALTLPTSAFFDFGIYINQSFTLALSA
jgi:hypothetical protein